METNVTEAPSVLLSQETYVIINNIILYVLSFPVSLFGLVSNVINAAVFLKMGLNDSVSVSLLALFIADFIFLLLAAYRPIVQSLLMSGIANVFVTNMAAVGLYTSFITHAFYLVSTLLTTYIALARCLCVAMPLKFQHIITMNQARVVVVAIYVFSMISHIPRLFSRRPVWHLKENSTVSILKLDRAAHHDALSDFHNIVNRTWIPYICLAICIVCLAVLSVKLRSASKFRAQATTGGKANEGPESSSTLNVKELQLVKAVFLLCAVFVFTATVRAAIGLALVFLPELETETRYRNVYFICMGLVVAIMSVNGAVNFLIFYRFNTKFRQTLSNWWGTEKAVFQQEQRKL